MDRLADLCRALGCEHLRIGAEAPGTKLVRVHVIGVS
jgi:hypothetical protein